MEVEIAGAERLDELRDDWLRLAEPTGHPFATWEWNSGWWRHFGNERPLYSFSCRQSNDGETAAILPLYVEKVGPLRIARFIGDGDLRSPICAPGSRSIAAEGLKRAIRPGRGNCSLLLAERLPREQGWAELLDGRGLATHPDPVLPVRGLRWEELLASRSRNFRQQVRRRERRLVEEHGLTFRLSTEPDRLDADLAALFRLHNARWEDKSSGVFEGARGEFHREFAVAAQRRGWLRLWMAEIDGEPVASWYGWRFAGSEWYYQAGRDRRFDDLSLGFVLLAHTVREACEDGVDDYRFLDGAEAYKWRFASADLGAESRLIAAGPVARASSLVFGAAAAAPKPLRRRIMRTMG